MTDKKSQQEYGEILIKFFNVFYPNLEKRKSKTGYVYDFYQDKNRIFAYGKHGYVLYYGRTFGNDLEKYVPLTPLNYLKLYLSIWFRSQYPEIKITKIDWDFF